MMGFSMNIDAADVKDADSDKFGLIFYRLLRL